MRINSSARTTDGADRVPADGENSRAPALAHAITLRRGENGWRGTTLGGDIEDDAEILLDTTIIDIPPRADLTVKLNFQQLEPPRMQVDSPLPRP